MRTGWGASVCPLLRAASPRRTGHAKQDRTVRPARARGRARWGGVPDTPSGWVAITWYFSVNGGGVERFNVDPTNDPATQIVFFSRTSPTCVRFYGTGRQDNGELHFFWIDACDNANPGVGYDTFGLTSPPGFNSSGTLTQGDIAISTF